jgi:restriction system protein
MPTRWEQTGPRIKVQVKRRDTEKVSAEGLGAFMAVLGEQDVGIYISAAGFTAHPAVTFRERRRANSAHSAAP